MTQDKWVVYVSRSGRKYYFLQVRDFVTKKIVDHKWYNRLCLATTFYKAEDAEKAIIYLRRLYPDMTAYLSVEKLSN